MTPNTPEDVSDADLAAFIAFLKRADIGPTMITALAIAESLQRHRAENNELDAKRYRYLRDLDCNHFYLTKNADHAPNYMTANEYIESSHGDEWMKGTNPAEIQRMKDTNTIWCLQVYPLTPIGFNVWNAATLDSAIDSAMSNASEEGKT